MTMIRRWRLRKHVDTEILASLFWPVYRHPQFSEYPGLTDMKLIVRQKQHAATMEASKLDSTEIVFDSIQPQNIYCNGK